MRAMHGKNDDLLTFVLEIGIRRCFELRSLSRTFLWSRCYGLVSALRKSSQLWVSLLSATKESKHVHLSSAKIAKYLTWLLK